MNTELKVTYDNTLKLMQISPSVWQAIGPMQWFNDYRIISTGSSYFNDDTRIIDLTKHYRGAGNLPAKISTILASQTFRELVIDMHLERHKLILARPMRSSLGKQVLSNDSKIASKFENKVWFRQQLDSQLTFPPFVIMSLQALAEDTFSSLQQQLGAEAIIIQDAKLSGGRGTYSVANDDEYEACVSRLSGSTYKEQAHDLVVVSKRLPRILERTLQMCITGSAVYIGPVQAQLLSHPLLVSDRPTDIQFCGGRIMPGLVTNAQYQAMSEAARTVGEELQRCGYRGILGMDFIISDEQVYPIEVNPRLTGLSLLLAFLQKEVPFLLLHILELAHSPHDITIDPTVADQNIQGSFIQVYAQGEGTCTLRSGLYDSDGNWLAERIEGGGIMPKVDGQYFVAMRVEPGQQVSRGKSLAFIYSNEQLFDDQSGLNAAVTDLIRRVRE